MLCPPALIKPWPDMCTCTHTHTLNSLAGQHIGLILVLNVTHKTELVIMGQKLKTHKVRSLKQTKQASFK